MTGTLPHRAGARGSAVSCKGESLTTTCGQVGCWAPGNTTSWFSFVPVLGHACFVWAVVGLELACFVALCFCGVLGQWAPL